ncbi:MAG: hypothetical protein HY714_00070 [Candidatus Omnitrophica bacterium]|nr:hypothetical protein [Candidatus Omnitrophota bacterium]
MNPYSQLRRWFALAACLAVLSGCGTIRKHPNFDQRSAEIAVVSVMPPDVLLQRIVFKGDNEVMYRESESAKKILSDALRGAFAGRGYEAKPFEITKALRKKYPEVSTDWSKLTDKYNERVKDVQTQFVAKMKYADFKLSLGADVNPFADHASADVLVFMVAAGYINSAGENTKNFFKSILVGVGSLGSYVPIYNSFGGAMHVTVVDGDNGDLLWHNFSPPTLAYNLTDEKALRKMVQATLKGFPDRKAAAVSPGAVEVREPKIEVDRVKISPPLPARPR